MVFIYLIPAVVFGFLTIWLAKTNVRLKSILRGRRQEIEKLSSNAQIIKRANEGFKQMIEKHVNELSNFKKKSADYEEIIKEKEKEKSEANFELYELRGKLFDVDASIKVESLKLKSKEDELNSLKTESDSQRTIIQRLEVQNKSVKQVFENIQRSYQECVKQVKELESTIAIKDELYKCLENKSNESVSKITSLYSDYLLIQYDISEKYLREKKTLQKLKLKG